MSIGPTCAIADVQADHMTIFCNSQQPSSVPTTLAAFQLNGQPYFGLPAKEIRCVYYEGASSFGGMLGTGGQTDVYIGAAIISKAVGKPVRLQWMRWDEHAWAAYGPAAMYDVKAGVDANGNMTALDWTSYGQAGTSLQTSSELVGFAHLAGDPRRTAVPATSDGIYKVSATAKRVLAKTQPQYGGSFKSDPLRAPGAPQSHFAGEQLIDEIAVRDQDGPARAPQAEHRRQHRRRRRAGWRRSTRPPRSPAGRPRPPHSGDRPRRATSAPVAASRSGRSRTRRSGWSPTSR